MIRSEPVLKRILVGPLVVLVVAVLAYGGYLAYRDRTDNDVAPASAAAVDVRTAIEAPIDTELSVTGYVFTDEFTGDLLCSERSAGTRPACEGVAAKLQQLDPTRLDLVRAEQKKGGYDAWSRDRVVLRVVARRGVFVVRDVLPVPSD